uniref:Uncharacterized protein n=1 Tax=Arundo donax TaxID=35708 RepID=A0A0A9DB88_ARUDO
MKGQSSILAMCFMGVVLQTYNIYFLVVSEEWVVLSMQCLLVGSDKAGCFVNASKLALALNVYFSRMCE